MSIFVASIFLSSCSSSINSESNPTKISADKKEVSFIPATDEDIFLYRQIGISYLCMARQIEVEFPKAISLAAKNYALLISCLLYTSPSPRDRTRSRMPSSA